VNQLTQDDQYDYTYDVDGNLTTKTERTTPYDQTTYTFDADNRLTRKIRKIRKIRGHHT
jgi:YD repeat-containing protein